MTSPSWPCLRNIFSKFSTKEQRSVPKTQRNISCSNEDVKTAVVLKVETAIETPTTFKPIAHDRQVKMVIIAHFDEIPDWMPCDPYVKHGYLHPQNSFIVS